MGGEGFLNPKEAIDATRRFQGDVCDGGATRRMTRAMRGWVSPKQPT